jgi:5-methylcytosine-specific restriction endonuclease McrA
MPRTGTPRQTITADMKIDCLLYRYAVTCAICGKDLRPGDVIEWDHVAALVHGGQHVFSNLRPLHEDCHKAKTARDVAANAKVKRLLGETCNGPKKKIPARDFPEGHRPIPSRPFTRKPATA